MATSSYWENIEEDFFHCSICLDQYKEPKLLPCVHRFCKECLQRVIEKCLNILECPLCKEKCDLPKSGVNGFKTDFHMKSLLEVIQLQKSLDKEEIRECVGCSKQRKAASYCFKCTGFLCETCYQFHLDSPMLKDHKSNVVTLKEIQRKGLSFSSLREAPRCEVHPEKLLELCCVSCDNLPVCIVCGLCGKHKGHDLQEITKLASVERQKLVDNLSILDSHKSSVYDLPQKIEEFKEKLSAKINTKQEQIQMKHEAEMGKFETLLQASRLKLDRDLQEIATKEETNLVNLKSEMEKEIQEIRKKYKNLIDINTQDHNERRQELKAEQISKEQALRIQMKQLELCKTEFSEKLVAYSNNINEQIEDIATISRKRISRLENCRTSANSILASENDWTDVSCLPDINAAFKALLDDLVRGKFWNSSIFPDINIPVSHTYIAEEPHMIAYIDNFLGSSWTISGIANVEDGELVVTGSTKYAAHITVVSTRGKIIHQYHVNTRGSSRSSYCASISPSEVVIVVRPSEIGIFNVRGYTFTSKNMEDLTTEWTSNDSFRCVAFDSVTCNIFVGSESKKVLMFNSKMNYCKTIFLPEIITYARTMKVHDETFLVCCVGPGKVQRAYSLKMHDDDFDCMFGFDEPDICKGHWKAYDVYIDDNGYIYVVWEVDLDGDMYKGFVTQYSQDGRVKLLTREMKVSRITTVKADGIELLIGTSSKKGKIMSYQLTKM